LRLLIGLITIARIAVGRFNVQFSIFDVLLKKLWRVFVFFDVTLRLPDLGSRLRGNDRVGVFCVGDCVVMFHLKDAYSDYL